VRERRRDHQPRTNFWAGVPGDASFTVFCFTSTDAPGKRPKNLEGEPCGGGEEGAKKSLREGRVSPLTALASRLVRVKKYGSRILNQSKGRKAIKGHSGNQGEESY